MIRIIGKIPKKVTVACSGGLDSMAVVDFLRKGKREISLAYFNHDTLHGREAEAFVDAYAERHSLPLLVGRMMSVKGKRSIEEYWRDERYSFLNRINSDFIVTCHHLDDCVETWLMSSINGFGKLIPHRRGDKIFRPFLMTSRSTIEGYAEKNSLSWIEDPSNQSNIYMRNYTRNVLMPHVLKINPGIKKTIRKKLIEKYQ